MPSPGSVVQLDSLPRVGFIDTPSPVTSLTGLAARTGLASLHAKRDDLIPALGGGNKPRKLDYLLAAPPFDHAGTWQSMGGIGSGHLVALAQAAHRLDRRLVAHCFDQPLSPHVERNLGLLTLGSTELHFYASRLTLALRRPWLLLGGERGASPVIAAGGTTPAGMLGFVRAGLELGDQIRAGALPEPRAIYLPLGTGGTAAGLSVGLGLAGIRTCLHAVAVVERPFACQRRLHVLQQQVLAWLVAQGLMGPHGPEPVPIRLDRRQVGPGYGRDTTAALDACALLAAWGIALEPVYSGKAMAALLHDAPALAGEPVLFWMTARGQALEPPVDWRQRLPEPLARRLGGRSGALTMSRRQFLLTGTVAVAGTALGCRGTDGDPAAGPWQGRVLSAGAAGILAAAAEVLLPRRAGGPEPLAVARNVDRYLVALPQSQQEQVALMLLVIEHGTLLGLHVHRFTRLAPADRLSFLQALQASRTMLAQAYRGLRDLCLLGYYQDPATWDRLDYGGPWLANPGGQAVSSAHYEAMRAPRGVLPTGSRR